MKRYKIGDIIAGSRECGAARNQFLGVEGMVLQSNTGQQFIVEANGMLTVVGSDIGQCPCQYSGLTVVKYPRGRNRKVTAS